MAVTIRLKRIGKKKTPFYRVVVQDRRRAPSGPIIEELGTYDPTQNPSKAQWKSPERLELWLSRGAKPSETVQDLLKKAGLMPKASPAS